ncbi:NAD-dependent epimerase [Patiriisocius marinistellae]|uniref:NAD-dependent epimerase n=1 Tax=Patiriisocius marinistellae TaxID=2494560 RepID=A0A5J4FXA3_9FLAO|nr:TIGR01777 family oxidoreductase [Patiriisocius marinistellae]GEQ85764.1 NAD-dependent epimerase [Patiriisocius marinistellae]
MKVLITGATGLIGSKITELCHDKGIAVHYLTTSKEKIKNTKNYQGFYWNPAEGLIDAKAFNGVTTIINLVGATIAKRWTKSYKKIILDSRTQTANLIFETLKSIDHSVGHFISASGISIYPNSEVELYTEEYVGVEDSFLGEVVVAWEAVANQFKSLGIDVAKVRTGVVFDKNDGAFSKLVEPVKMGAPAAIGNGNQWLSWIHIDDIAGIYMKLLKDRDEGVFNAVAPTPVTNKRITKLLSNKYNVPMWLPNIPSFVLKLALGEMAILVTEGQLVSSKKIEALGYKFMYYNIDNALDDLVEKK